MAGDVIKEFLGKKSIEWLFNSYFTPIRIRRENIVQSENQVKSVESSWKCAHWVANKQTQKIYEVEQYNNGPHSVHSHSMICTIDMSLLHYYPTTTVQSLLCRMRISCEKIPSTLDHLYMIAINIIK